MQDNENKMDKDMNLSADFDGDVAGGPEVIHEAATTPSHDPTQAPWPITLDGPGMYIREDDSTDVDESTSECDEPEAPNSDSDAPIPDSEPTPPIDDEADVPTLPPKFTYKDLVRMARNTANLVNSFQQQFNDITEEYGVTTEQLSEAVKYNTSVRMTEDDWNATEHAEDAKYDQLNGIDNIPDDKIDEIFGVNSGIRGVDRTQTIDRLKSAISVFYSLWRAHSDLDYLQSELSKIMAEQEEASMNALREEAMNGATEEIRNAAAEKVKEYENNKYLEFLSHEGFANQKRILTAFTNEPKLNYLMDRARIYLRKLDVSEKFLLEISSFEKRFLPEKYHAQNNVLLILFMSLLVYGGKIEQGSAPRRRMIGFVLALDRFIRNKLELADRDRIYKNIIAFEDIILNNLDIGGNASKTNNDTTTAPSPSED